MFEKTRIRSHRDIETRTNCGLGQKSNWFHNVFYYVIEYHRSPNYGDSWCEGPESDWSWSNWWLSLNRGGFNRLDDKIQTDYYSRPRSPNQYSLQKNRMIP